MLDPTDAPFDALELALELPTLLFVVVPLVPPIVLLELPPPFPLTAPPPRFPCFLRP
jgi:hypothetical protein